MDYFNTLGLPAAEPRVHAYTSTIDGFKAQTYAVVDSMPALISLEVDTRTPRNSIFELRVFSYEFMTWAQVALLDSDDVSQRPAAIDEDATLGWLNTIALKLWTMAGFVLPLARQTAVAQAVERDLRLREARTAQMVEVPAEGVVAVNGKVVEQ